MANRLNLFRQGAVGFIDWLDLMLGIENQKPVGPENQDRVESIPNLREKMGSNRQKN
jgi:hypothetical protein